MCGIAVNAGVTYRVTLVLFFIIIRYGDDWLQGANL